MTDLSVDSPVVATEELSERRPLYWSVQRELWENRSIILAPVIVTTVFLFGFLLSTVALPHRLRTALAADAARQHAAVTAPFGFIAGLLITTAFFVGLFYCADALHSERSDRSILFWKSLPVSNLTAVLSKAAIPMAVLPAFVFALIVAAQIVMLTLSTLALAGNGAGEVLLWTHVKFFQSTVALLYGVIAIALWHAPVYAWFLLASAWARRAVLLWAIVPLIAVSIFERMVFGTALFAHLLGQRLVGWFKSGFVFADKGASIPLDPLASLTPIRFLTAPGLWIGFLFTAAFLAAAVRLRRDREPI